MGSATRRRRSALCFCSRRCRRDVGVWDPGTGAWIGPPHAMFAPRGKRLLVYRPDKGTQAYLPANVNTPADLTVGGDSR
jgi:hypothetical protein